MKRGCLDAAELERVLKGDASAESFDSAISHLDECPRCRDAAESILPSRSWLSEEDSEEFDSLQSETACQAAMSRLLNHSGLSGSGLNSHLHSPALPQQQLGPYRLLKPLGSGGMACVFLAEHRRLKRRCAIKILPRERVDQPGWLDRFDREMTSVASLEHPHVVRATDAGHQDGWHYLVMEYLEGMDVGAIATRMVQLEVADACQIIRQAAMGLSHVHHHGLVHRDIKPSNLMLVREGTVKLLDLGLVLAGDDPLSVDDRLTTVGHLMGTLPYMAPEQLLDSRDVDASADLYSLGATFFRLLTGRLPHQPRGGLARQVMTITGQTAPPVISLRQDLGSDLASLVDQMLDRDPAQRPASADEVAERLEKAAQPARLKKLLRDACRKPAPKTPSPSQLWLSHPQAAAAEPPPRRWPRIAAAMLPLLVLCGWVIKIATDRGELVIHNNVRDARIEVSQGDEVVERLSVQSGDDNTFKLRKGSYTIAISGTDELILSKNEVTIGRGEQAQVNVLPKGSDRLYQGKTFETWLDVLTREADVQTIGQAMSALEILSRETALRERAAKATLKTARMWGGFVSSAPSDATSARDPSRVYMHYLREVFPKYGEVGTEALLEELDKGNPRSRTAAIFLASTLELEPNKNANLTELLKTATASLEDSSVPFASTVRKHAKTLAVKSLVTQGKKITTHPWLIDHVQDEIRRNMRRSEQPYYAPSNSPYVEYSLLVAAIQLEVEGLLELDWNWVARNLLNQNDAIPRNQLTERIFSTLKQEAPDALLDALHMRLATLQTSSLAPSIANDYGKEYDAAVGSYSPSYALTLSTSLWPTMLEFYAENVDDERIFNAVDQLKNLRRFMVNIGVDADHPGQPLRFIDAAIETLERRAEEE